MNHRNKVHEEKSWQSLSGFERDGEDMIIDENDKVDNIKE